MTDPDITRYWNDPVFHARVQVTERLLHKMLPGLAMPADTALRICSVQDEVLHHTPDQQAPLVELGWYFASQYERLLGIHAAVQMDTPEDKATHARTVAVFHDALTRGIAKLVEASGPRPTQTGPVNSGQ